MTNSHMHVVNTAGHPVRKPNAIVLLAVIFIVSLVATLCASKTMAGLPEEQVKRNKEAAEKRAKELKARAQQEGLPVEFVEQEDRLLEKANLYLHKTQSDKHAYFYVNLLLIICIPIISAVVTGLATIKAFSDKQSQDSGKPVSQNGFRLIVATAVVSGILTTLNALNSSLTPGEQSLRNAVFQDRVDSFVDDYSTDKYSTKVSHKENPEQLGLYMMKWISQKRQQLDGITEAWNKGEKTPPEHRAARLDSAPAPKDR